MLHFPFGNKRISLMPQADFIISDSSTASPPTHPNSQQKRWMEFDGPKASSSWINSHISTSSLTLSHLSLGRYARPFSSHMFMKHILRLVFVLGSSGFPRHVVGCGTALNWTLGTYINSYHLALMVDTCCRSSLMVYGFTNLWSLLVPFGSRHQNCPSRRIWPPASLYVTILPSCTIEVCPPQLQHQLQVSQCETNAI